MSLLRMIHRAAKAGRHIETNRPHEEAKAGHHYETDRPHEEAKAGHLHEEAAAGREATTGREAKAGQETTAGREAEIGHPHEEATMMKALAGLTTQRQKPNWMSGLN